MSLPAYVGTTAPTAAGAPEAAAQRAPRLQIVRAPETHRSLLPFFLLCALILAGSLVGALLLNTAMAVSSYRIHDQQAKLTLLQERGGELANTLEVLGSPTSLEQAARELGMVRSAGRLYISLDSRSIVRVAGED